MWAENALAPGQRAANEEPIQEAVYQVKPGDNANFQNFDRAQRIVEHTLGVRMRYRRRPNWERWLITYAGPQDSIYEAAAVGELALTHPDFYADPPPKEPREFASVTKW